MLSDDCAPARGQPPDGGVACLDTRAIAETLGAKFLNQSACVIFRLCFISISARCCNREVSGELNMNAVVEWSVHLLAAVDQPLPSERFVDPKG